MNSGNLLKKIPYLSLELGLFQDNLPVLTRALAHRSYIHETGGESNERLEFLGDSVLSLVISEYIYQHFPRKSEGDLSKWRAYLVSAKTLAGIARKLELGKYLLLGHGEDKGGGRERQSLLADTMEALIAAIYLEYGWERVKAFILEHWAPLFTKMNKYKQPIDPKTLLQEALQSKGSIPHYQMLKMEGPDHNRVYSMAVYDQHRLLGKGSGLSKKQAEQEAAEEALKLLETLPNK